MISVFATVRDTFRYITKKKTVPTFWSSMPVTVTPLADGTSSIEIRFEGQGAAMIFFGAE